MKYEKCVRDHLIEYKNNTLGISENGIWKNNKEKYPHILPEGLKDLNLLPIVNIPDGIKKHKDTHHLNSSQIMCINFFEPLLHDDEGKKLLLDILKQETPIKIENNATIKEACFEYKPFPEEETQFDFYVELSSGEKIYFEIKYTEESFSPAEDISHYKEKWSKIHVNHISESLYLKDIAKEKFYNNNYQLWRIISYIKTDRDYAVLLVPQLNDTQIPRQQTLESFKSI